MKTSDRTILYGKWPINLDNPGEAIQISQILEDSKVDWFPKGSLIFVRISDMIRIWDQGELELFPVFKKTPDNIMFSKDFKISIYKPGYAHIEILGGKGIIEMETNRIVNWSGFKNESVMLDCMKEFFDYHE